MLHMPTALSAIILIAALTAPAYAQPTGLEGNWQGPGGIIRGETCPDGKSLCVVVVAGNNDKESMADIVGKTVVRDLVSDGPGKLRGRYVSDGKNLVATVTLKDTDHAELRVCLLSWFPWVFCEAPTYTRVR